MKIRVESLHDGALRRIVLDAPKGNVLDAEMVAQLDAAFTDAGRAPGCKALLLAAEGRHFSFGASVEEHLPESVAGMLGGFHQMFLTLASTHLPVVAAVRGQCLGGGLELAAFCQRLVAAPDAQLGQPEIVLGVIAPVASIVLPERVGRAVADDLLTSGRSLGAAEALRVGLVDEVADDPEAAALAWIERHLLPRSASSLRYAVHAARLDFDERFAHRIDQLTHLYLDGLMSTSDAVEGIRAFVEKRAPRWSDA
ncbi:MAG: cyclohexa-1,5-dienecarbonyl-CoA hydratase [Planctomycetes bacterium]|nr:cyclohexa-1,5-dienecarbonyl-CoA hydratase [Planctomycetota bacterium]